MKIGSIDISKVHLGSNEVGKMYLGSTLIWPSDFLPISNGLIAWLDGRDITSGATYWEASTKVQSIYPGFKLQFASGNTLVAGTCMRVGSNGGASMQTGSSAKSCNNPFVEGNVAANGSMTIEVVFCGASTYLGNRFGGGTYYGNSFAQWRYQFYISESSGPSWQVHNGSAWEYIIQSDTVVNDGNPHVVSWQKDGSTCRLYIDGVLDKEVTNTTLRLPVGATNNLVGIGRYNDTNSSQTNNYLADYYSYAIYNRALSASEIHSNYITLFNRYNLWQ